MVLVGQQPRYVGAYHLLVDEQRLRRTVDGEHLNEQLLDVGFLDLLHRHLDLLGLSFRGFVLKLRSDFRLLETGFTYLGILAELKTLQLGPAGAAARRRFAGQHRHSVAERRVVVRGIRANRISLEHNITFGAIREFKSRTF